MTTRRLLPAGLMTLLGFVLLGAAAPGDGKKVPAKDANAITGVLRSVDARNGTFTLEQVGVDVDEALAANLKERGKDEGAGGRAKPRAAGDAKTQVVAINAKTRIYIKFRSSPSVANNVEMQLKDLEKMAGYPVTAELATAGDKPVAAEVVAWRGTPWRVSK